MHFFCRKLIPIAGDFKEHPIIATNLSFSVSFMISEALELYFKKLLICALANLNKVFAHLNNNPAFIEQPHSS